MATLPSHAVARAATIRAVRLPEVIPIKYLPDYRTDRIGRHAGGQFFADITGAYQEGVTPGHDWRHQQRIYAVLHRFDDGGHHVGSDIWFAGVRAESPAAVERAEQVLSGWLSDIGPVTYCDITIRPFRADFDNVVFGLIDETTDDPYEGHGGPWAELHPQRLGFHEPWDGEYDT
ncbi:hypothetical protein GCM10010399_39220 [Dactylosporangium fulvum]